MTDEEAKRYLDLPLMDRLRDRGELMRRVPLGVVATIIQATKLIEQLSEFIEQCPCECIDEYGNSFPQACERCRVLGRKEDEPCT